MSGRKSGFVWLSLVLILSGAAALTYEIVWTRLLLLIFGSTTHSVVAVLWAYMGGLALGSYLVGKRADTHRNPLRLYALLEIAAGVLAALTLPGLLIAQSVYVHAFHWLSSPSTSFLLKFALTSLILFPATVAMGGTLPVLTQWVSLRSAHSPKKLISWLYAANTLGAVAGTLLAGFVWIELAGLRISILGASAVDVLLGAAIWYLAPRTAEAAASPAVVTSDRPAAASSYPAWKVQLALIIFGISGLTSMAYEVAWMRLLTPTTGNYIYAFSLILALVLLGVTVGSAAAPLLFRGERVPLGQFAAAEFGLCLGAVVSLLAGSHLTNFGPVGTVLLTTLPASFCMGLTFPVVASLPHPERAQGSFIGKAYAVNTVGCLLGPLVAGFALLPAFGTTDTVLSLALLNGLMAAALVLMEQNVLTSRTRIVCAASTVLVLGLGFLFGIGHQETFEGRRSYQYLAALEKRGYPHLVAEDETAAVLAWKRPGSLNAGLLVDGVGMTELSVETKLIGHLPLLLLPNAKNMLVIAFGMGTTFRSALTHDIHVDAVELVPSVPKAFPVFHEDAAQVLANPNGRIFINDGRNYVLVAEQQYDAVVVDPPPPINAAGTTVLYSREFYQQAKRILRPDGLFLQWLFYGARNDDYRMLVKSFADEFPYIAVFRSPHRAGLFLVGSRQPIVLAHDVIAKALSAPAVARDLNEWGGGWTAESLLSLYLGDRQLLERYAGTAPPVTDDHPATEYFILRHRFSTAPLVSDETVLTPSQTARRSE